MYRLCNVTCIENNYDSILIYTISSVPIKQPLDNYLSRKPSLTNCLPDVEIRPLSRR